MTKGDPPLSPDEKDQDARQQTEEEAVIEDYRWTDLRLDREGRFWHEGQLVTHPRLLKALHRWIDMLEDGRYILRIDEMRYVYLDVEDAPFLVRTVQIERSKNGIHIWVLLSDETEEELEYKTLVVGKDSALYCKVKDRFWARFSRQAYYLIGEFIEEYQDGFALRAGGALWPIAQREGP